MCRVSPAKLARNAPASLVAIMPTITTTVCVVTAIEPDLAAPRSELCQPTGRKPLHPRGPLGIDDALERGVRNPDRIDGAQRGNGKPRIVELVPAEQFWRGEVHQATIVLIDQPPAFDA